MGEDFQSALNAILSDPKKMGDIQALAKQLTDSPPAQTEPAAESTVIPGMLDALKSMFKGEHHSEAEQLLRAMEPYMRPGRRSKLEHALKLTRIWHAAKSVMEQYGGEPDGI